MPPRRPRHGKNSGNGGISILTPDANQSALMFGTLADPVGAYTLWDYTNNLLTLATGKANAGIQFKTGDEVDAMRILGNGNVGIATTSPTHTLNVVGSLNVTNATIQGNVSIVGIGTNIVWNATTSTAIRDFVNETGCRITRGLSGGTLAVC